ncbi:MAG: hypothetical protein L0332_06585 [Chloroflexi bacterium]|nr:hypothetical protein [Chloroflexota bacterium]MCI0575845.1 hypothetical protein [Chloroflexota bacterium]MCI0646572.1 hypothetical protein [Chloroflexota bacterium]MCI0726374.1 hypothetical protein [Chloroflexota bacterium]
MKKVATDQRKPTRRRVSHRMPAGSLFYEKVIPFLLAGLAILMALLILSALGILLGVVPFN